MIQAESLSVAFMSESSAEKRAGWYALYTKGRHEKLLDRELRKKGLNTFLPVRRVVRHWSDRKKIIEEPLFKSYVFVQMSLNEKVKALSTPGAVCFVSGAEQHPLLIPEKDIEAVRCFSQAELPADPFPYLKKGDRVYIRSGPLKGIEGFIVYKNQQCRLVISIDALMQSISVEVDQACVERL